MREKAMSLCLIPQILHILREGIYHYCLGKDPKNTTKKRPERIIQGISEFYLKICKNPRAIADQEWETWHLARLFYLLTTQDRSDGYKSHGEGKVSKF